jgi:hypothetical protein
MNDMGPTPSVKEPRIHQNNISSGKLLCGGNAGCDSVVGKVFNLQSGGSNPALPSFFPPTYIDEMPQRPEF